MSAFYEEVWALARTIPAGFVMSYGQIARRLGHPKAARAVGGAMHAAPGDVPCQRVVRSDGGLSDAFQPLGRESHRVRLMMEGVKTGENGRVDLKRYGWKE